VHSPANQSYSSPSAHKTWCAARGGTVLPTSPPSAHLQHARHGVQHVAVRSCQPVLHSAHLQLTRHSVQHVAVRSCQPVLQLTFGTQDVVCSMWQYGPANQSSFSSPGVVCSTWYYGTTRAKCSYNVMHVQQKQQCKMVTQWELWTRLDIPITRCHPLCKGQGGTVEQFYCL